MSESLKYAWRGQRTTYTRRVEAILDKYVPESYTSDLVERLVDELVETWNDGSRSGYEDGITNYSQPY